MWFTCIWFSSVVCGRRTYYCTHTVRIAGKNVAVRRWNNLWSCSISLYLGLFELRRRRFLARRPGGLYEMLFLRVSRSHKSHFDHRITPHECGILFSPKNSNSFDCFACSFHSVTDRSAYNVYYTMYNIVPRFPAVRRYLKCYGASVIDWRNENSENVAAVPVFLYNVNSNRLYECFWRVQRTAAVVVGRLECRVWFR